MLPTSDNTIYEAPELKQVQIEKKWIENYGCEDTFLRNKVLFYVTDLYEVVKGTKLVNHRTA